MMFTLPCFSTNLTSSTNPMGVRVFTFVFLSLVSTLAYSGSGERPAFPDPSTTSPAEIARLINGLAADSYATRIRCRDRLMRIGLAAFDQLREARDHPDNEVAIVARRLTSGLRVRWATPADSADARELLSEYGSHSPAERRKRIAELAALPRRDAFSPLLRLARFETEPTLARTAALALIGLDTLPRAQANSDPADSPAADSARDGKQMRKEAAQIESTIKDRERISDQWLWQFASDLRAGQPRVQAWLDLIGRNRENLAVEEADSASESDVSTSQLLQLVWILAERALTYGQDADALEMVVENVDLIPARTRNLIPTAAWALDHSLYEAVVAMHDAHPALYEKSPILLYSAAESLTRLERQSEAAELVDVALGINPLPRRSEREADEDAPDDATPSKSDEAAAMHPQTIETHAEAHIMIATQLVDRGLFQWAEKEYDLVIDRLPIDNPYSSFARLRLALMFGELLRHAAVIETLTPLAERIDQDDEFRDRLNARRFPYADVHSNIDYHRGLLMIEHGEADAAKSVLRGAFEMNPRNIDILIAMYRLKGGPQWESDVAKTLAEHIELASNRITEIRASVQRAGGFRRSKRDLANALNAYAWLVGNTEGDLQRALRCSKESLKLIPNKPELMDTCARCYFALGDLQAAVDMQAKACEIMPHSPPLQRQLEEFRDALGESF